MTTGPITPLGELCTFISDGSHNPPKGIDSSDFLMLSSRDIQNGKLTFEKPRYLAKEDFLSEDRRTNLQIGDVLLTTVGTIGRTAIYNGTPKHVTFQRSVSVLRPNNLKITAKYLMYSLESMNELLNKEARGVAQQGIYLNQLKKLGIATPPIDMQNRIVEVLEDHLSRLDAALADVERARMQAARFRRSFLHDAFAGRPRSRGPRQKGKILENWTQATIGDVAEIVRGVTYSKGDTLKANDSGAVPLLRATNLEVDVIDFEEMVYVPMRVVKPQQYLRLNDILLAASSGSISVVGKSAQVIKTNGETFGAFCAVIRPTGVNPKYLAYWVQSPEIRDRWSAKAKGTNINNLRPGDISKTPISLPSIEVQGKIVELVEEHLSRLVVSMSLANEIVKQSSDLRRSLLKAAFTGQLTREVSSV